jgi:hypothetical protein
VVAMFISSRSIDKHGRQSNLVFWLVDFEKYSLIAWPNDPKLGREPSIDASYQVSDHLAKRF